MPDAPDVGFVEAATACALVVEEPPPVVDATKAGDVVVDWLGPSVRLSHPEVSRPSVCCTSKYGMPGSWVTQRWRLALHLPGQEFRCPAERELLDRPEFERPDQCEHRAQAGITPSCEQLADRPNSEPGLARQSPGAHRTISDEDVESMTRARSCESVSRRRNFARL